ncbi:class I SAM-dependent methyltransferase [Terriglobus sp. RCC_193]|uniref:class I SAM-dependent methyltransferase n=1 Tax=Terriglobus sp. RCC_193 TaxID=3239218 RepID=UPI0035246E77
MSPTHAPGTDYGVDAPAVMRNLFLIGFACLLAGLLLPPVLHLGPVALETRPMFLWPAAFLIGEALLFLLYVKYGKFRHRDFILRMHTWRGDEQVLDVGCGRGLLLAGAAKKLTTGHATGIDIWSTEDMGGNAEAATLHNLQLEGIADRCTLVSVPAQDITFPKESFDVIVSNLCLHNIYSKSHRTYALNHIVRVLKPGGIALISDYKLTSEYADYFHRNGLEVTAKRGSFLTTFPPLKVVIARKPA